MGWTGMLFTEPQALLWTFHGISAIGHLAVACVIPYVTWKVILFIGHLVQGAFIFLVDKVIPAVCDGSLQVYRSVVAGIKLVGSGIARIFGFIGEGIVRILSSICNGIVQIFRFIGNGILWISNGIWNGIKLVGSGICNIFSFICNGIKALFKGLWDVFTFPFRLLYRKLRPSNDDEEEEDDSDNDSSIRASDMSESGSSNSSSDDDISDMSDDDSSDMSESGSSSGSETETVSISGGPGGDRGGFFWAIWNFFKTLFSSIWNILKAMYYYLIVLPTYYLIWLPIFHFVHIPSYLKCGVVGLIVWVWELVLAGYTYMRNVDWSGIVRQLVWNFSRRLLGMSGTILRKMRDAALWGLNHPMYLRAIGVIDPMLTSGYNCLSNFVGFLIGLPSDIAYGMQMISNKMNNVPIIHYTTSTLKGVAIDLGKGVIVVISLPFLALLVLCLPQPTDYWIRARNPLFGIAVDTMEGLSGVSLLNPAQDVLPVVQYMVALHSIYDDIVNHRRLPTLGYTGALIIAFGRNTVSGTINSTRYGLIQCSQGFNYILPQSALSYFPRLFRPRDLHIRTATREEMIAERYRVFCNIGFLFDDRELRVWAGYTNGQANIFRFPNAWNPSEATYNDKNFRYYTFGLSGGAFDRFKLWVLNGEHAEWPATALLNYWTTGEQYQPPPPPPRTGAQGTDVVSTFTNRIRPTGPLGGSQTEDRQEQTSRQRRGGGSSLGRSDPRQHQAADDNDSGFVFGGRDDSSDDEDSFPGGRGGGRLKRGSAKRDRASVSSDSDSGEPAAKRRKKAEEEDMEVEDDSVFSEGMEEDDDDDDNDEDWVPEDENMPYAEHNITAKENYMKHAINHKHR